MKRYPPRPKTYDLPTNKYICECGHADFEHNYTAVFLTMPPQPDYQECGECMCPEYKFAHKEKLVTPL